MQATMLPASHRRARATFDMLIDYFVGKRVKAVPAEPVGVPGLPCDLCPRGDGDGKAEFTVLKHYRTCPDHLRAIGRALKHQEVARS